MTFAIVHSPTQTSSPQAGPASTTDPPVTGTPDAVVTMSPSDSPTSRATASPATVAPTSAPTQAPVANPGVAMPSSQLTPGETFAGVTTAEVCMSGWASAHRHVTQQQYYEVYAAYGVAYPQPSGTYELDHLIPLELGGDNSNANLWPEPASPTPGYHQKDDLENTLHDLVCSGQLALSTAQHDIATNWYAAYQQYG